MLVCFKMVVAPAIGVGGGSLVGPSETAARSVGVDQRCSREARGPQPVAADAACCLAEEVVDGDELADGEGRGGAARTALVTEGYPAEVLFARSLRAARVAPLTEFLLVWASMGLSRGPPSRA